MILFKKFTKDIFPTLRGDKQQLMIHLVKKLESMHRRLDYH
jgi:hypothetical protein